MRQRVICSVGFAFISLLIFLPAVALCNRPSDLEKIPDTVIAVSSGYVVAVDKQNQKLYVFKKNGVLTKVFEAGCSTGRNRGGKQISGDAKTPHGIFFATRIISNPGSPETYGTLAFPLDYPSLADKKAGRNGTNIWIHGTTKPLSPFQSNGCVVLADADVHALLKYIQINKTPIIISESITWIAQNKVPPVHGELENVLSAWNRAYYAGDIRSIDALYLEQARLKGKKRDDLLNRISAIRRVNEHFLWKPRDVSILRQHSNAVIVFDQITGVNKDSSFVGTYYRLSLERIHNRWFVIDDMEMPPAPAKTDGQTTASVREGVQNLISQWAKSWQAGDMTVYRSCYAPGFRAQGKNLDAWIQYKTSIRENSKNITIAIEGMSISGDDQQAVASFTQHYRSSLLKSKGTKQLHLRNIKGEWKIERESMR